MKFRNTINSFVPIGTRESVPPFGVTRDFTEEEIQKNSDLRHFVDKGYLVAWDGKTPLPPASAAAAKSRETKKPTFQPSSDVVDGEVKRITTATGRVVEYVSATDIGVDDVQTVDVADGIVAAVDGKKPLEHIEEGMTPEKSHKLGVNPAITWENASDAFEASLMEESSDEEFDDNKVLVEMEDPKEELPDADTEISSDYAQVLRDQGRMGSSLESVRDVIEEEAARANHKLAEATRPGAALDDGESIVGDASAQAAELLSQPFTTKKWAISKETNTEFLREVAAVTQSDNVRALAKQRLSELEGSAG